MITDLARSMQSPPRPDDVHKREVIMTRDQREALAELLRLARDEYLAGVELGDGERRRRGEWLMDEISRLDQSPGSQKWKTAKPR